MAIQNLPTRSISSFLYSLQSSFLFCPFASFHFLSINAILCYIPAKPFAWVLLLVSLMVIFLSSSCCFRRAFDPWLRLVYVASSCRWLFACGYLSSWVGMGSRGISLAGSNSTLTQGNIFKRLSFYSFYIICFKIGCSLFAVSCFSYKLVVMLLGGAALILSARCYSSILSFNRQI